MSDEGIKSTWRCAACGRENPATTARCSLCLAGRPGAAGVVAEPNPAGGPSVGVDEDYPKPSAPSTLPRSISTRLPPMLTGMAIITACVLLIPFFGVGLALLVALLPALIRLRRADYQPNSLVLDRPTDTGPWSCGAIGGAISFAALVLVSSLITFVAVCAPVGAMAINLWPAGYLVQGFVWVAGLAAGLATASFVGYSLVRLFFRTERRGGGPWEPPSTDIRP